MNKRRFKIVLDSNDTSSYIGRQFDATFNIDLTKILQKDEDFLKTYKVSFNFQSIISNSATTGIDNTDIYCLCLDFTRGYNTFWNRMTRNIVGNISVINDFTNGVSSTQYRTMFKSNETDNGQFLISNLKGLTSIRLTVYGMVSNNVFNNIDNGTVNTNSKYICILNFVEI